MTTPVRQQYLSIKKQFPETIMFDRDSPAPFKSSDEAVWEIQS
jgi:hypothetical protein